MNGGRFWDTVYTAVYVRLADKDSQKYDVRFSLYSIRLMFPRAVEMAFKNLCCLVFLLKKTKTSEVQFLGYLVF